MRLFLKNIILFLSIVYGSIFIMLIISNQIINSRASFKLKPNINKIVLGNSHPTGTFNDSLISNLKNLSDPGDSYFYGYQKLKELLKQNPQVDTVFVEFNPKTILKWEDSKLWRKHQVPNYLAFFEFEDHKLLATDNNIGYQQELIKGIAKNLKRIMLNQYNYTDSIGGYRYVNNTRIDAILDTLKYNPQKQYSLKENSLSEYDISYLNKMVSLCKNEDVQIIFVRSPYHKKFDGHRYETIFQSYRRENFGTIPFLDFQNFPLEDVDFKDLEHLNYIGARKFSLWFEKEF
ncbi:hypothetical protein ES692_10670 [Psychroserpens burtonensis]|uniref:DUF1574 domain-containing protein n=1 Tax=Psychroserpens burtonensis TaxID=49278 RepID=A0A5C7B6R8_9FLAO|nr:hypothetical protein [Psychroserpens burtonensis]TXE17113.1 hypothetical protein ES692_10670 [Psychroserpens burtonensis]